MDSLDAFQGLGHKTAVLKRGEGLDTAIKEFKPDLIFTVNHLGISISAIEALREAHIPLCSWFVDNPFLRVRDELLKASLEIESIIFSWDRFYLGRLKQFGFRHVFFLPMATNPRVFNRIERAKIDQDPLRCEVSFAGSSMYSHYQRFFERVSPEPSKRIRSALDDILNLQFQNHALYISDIVSQVEESHGFRFRFDNPDERRVFLMSLEEACSAKYRRDTLKRAIPKGLKLYGDPGWSHFMGGEVEFGGGLSYRTTLPRLYNASTINLNVTKIQLKTALCQRIFDGFACGFVLSDRKRDLGELLGVEDNVTFGNPDELEERLDYFLHHEAEREEIAEAIRQRILEDHTYERRMGVILSVFDRLYIG
jgi:spore maturation protein CgeB